MSGASRRERAAAARNAAQASEKRRERTVRIVGAVTVLAVVVGIIVIAVVYSSGVKVGYLGLAAAGIAVVALLKRLDVPWISIYVVVGVGVWYCTYKAGIHPTIAGAVMGLLAPAVPLKPYVPVPEFTPGRATVDRRISESLAASRFARESIPVTAYLGDLLHPFSSFVVVPLFALANAGVSLGGDAVSLLTDPVSVGIILGLVVGKPLGILAATEFAVRSKLADLPEGVTRAHVLAVGAVAGIGFTVALFVTALAYSGNSKVDAAKVGARSRFLVSWWSKVGECGVSWRSADDTAESSSG